MTIKAANKKNNDALKLPDPSREVVIGGNFYVYVDENTTIEFLPHPRLSEHALKWIAEGGEISGGTSRKDPETGRHVITVYLSPIGPK